MAVTIPNTFSANTLIKSAEVNADFQALSTAIPWNANPIAAKGDLIVGNTAGVSSTLSAGAANQVLKVVNGTPTWSTFTGGINYAAANPDFEADTSGWAMYNDTQVVTITNASPAVFTSAAAHGYSLGQRLTFITTGVLPTGLTAGDTYYVSSVDSSTDYKVSATLGGSNIDTTGAGGGVHTQCPLTPITGTAGVASGLALTRSTIAPLRGTASGLLTQSNATVVAGQGASFAFTIDAADKAKVIQVSMDFNASVDFTPSSGETGSHSDLEFFMGDVTNGVLIPISGNVITANGANNFTYSGTFQSASNSTSYRLGIHASTANAPATGFKFKFDNVFVGPQVTAQGAPITDWVADNTFTPSAGFGTITSLEVFKQRAGDSVKVIGSWTNGTVGASLAYISLPHPIDPSKLPSGTKKQYLGTYVQRYNSTVVDITSTDRLGVLFFDGTDASKLYLTNSVETDTFLLKDSNEICTNSDGVDFSIEYPVLGWASTVQMSQDTDTRVVAAEYNVASGSISGSDTIVKYTSLIKDTHSSYDSSTGLFTVPVSGFYSVTAGLLISGTFISGNSVNTSIYKNGSILQSYIFKTGGAYGDITGGISVAAIYCTAGDTLAIYANTDGTGPSYNGSSQYGYLSIARLSGPATIAASETVAARYVSTAGDSTSGSSTVFIPTTKEQDTHAAYNASTGIFTCPASGTYTVSGQINTTDQSGGNFVVLTALKGGVNIAKVATQNNSGGAETNCGLLVSATIPCLAGDLLQINIQNNGTTNLSTGAGENWVQFLRVGN